MTDPTLPPVRPGYNRDVPMEVATSTTTESVTEWNWPVLAIFAVAGSIVAGLVAPIAVILWRIAL